jgi:alginate O-acetyltransferase complex protein AlgI
VIFNSLTFFVFLAIVLPLFFILRGRAQLLLSLVASYVFYGWWDWRFLGLIALSTVVDFGLGLWIGGTEDPRRRKALLITSLVLNLGLLGYFKYCNFFLDSFRAMANQMGYSPSTEMLDIILPVGISFYTFQSLSYTLDVYSREIKAERSLLKYATFVAFFPQLVAGPIVRAIDFLPQMHVTHRFHRVRALSGAAQMTLGFFKKLVVADSAGLVVETIFAEPGVHTSIGLMVGVVFYAFQIYGDFSGYSDIAIGLARVMGFEFPENFRYPYISQSFSEFWTRWHISLSSWLRDYLYIPMGGNRQGTTKTYRNLMVTMLLGGLWHGASWKFVIWGGLHGIYLVFQRFFSWVASRLFPNVSVPRWIKAPLLITLVFTLTCLAWIFFRARDVPQAMEIITRILQFDSLDPRTIRNQTHVARGMLAIAILLILEAVHRRYDLHTRILRNPYFAAFMFAAGFWVIAMLGTFGNQQFIYFQF